CVGSERDVYKLREAVIEDFTDLALINDDPANSHLTDEQEKFSQAFCKQVLKSKTGRIYVVEKSGKIVGFILFHIKIDQGTIDIDRFSIHQANERKGIDEHMSQKVKRLAKRQRIKQMKATLTTSNPIVQTFFEENGWHPDVAESDRK